MPLSLPRSSVTAAFSGARIASPGPSIPSGVHSNAARGLSAARAGAPFELLALEQKAVALIGAGRPEDAITLIRQIQDKDGLTEALRRRLSEMMIALGSEPEPQLAMPSGVVN